MVFGFLTDVLFLLLDKVDGVLVTVLREFLSTLALLERSVLLGSDVLAFLGVISVPLVALVEFVILLLEPNVVAEPTALLVPVRVAVFVLREVLVASAFPSRKRVALVLAIVALFRSTLLLNSRSDLFLGVCAYRLLVLVASRLPN